MRYCLHAPDWNIVTTVGLCVAQDVAPNIPEAHTFIPEMCEGVSRVNYRV